MLVTTGDMADALEYLDKHETLAVDTETTGLRYHDRLFSVQFATKDREYHFDKRLLGGDFHKLKILFEKPRSYYLQNAKFDMRMLSWEGFTLSGTVHDVEVLMRLVKNDVMTTRLADTAKRYGMQKLDVVDKYVTKNKLYSKVTSKYWDKTYEYKHYDQVPIDVMAEYAEHDARITYDLAEILLKELPASSIPVYENECKLIPICLDMEMHGALIDRQYTEDMLKFESGLIHEAKHEFLLATGRVYDGSKQQLIDVFSKGGEIIPKTARGNPSMTDDILDSFKSPAAKIVQKVRHYEKRCSTYYSSFLDLCDDQGRIHADMRQAGTTTGRFSYRDPNLQNIPKEDSQEDLTKANLIRRCFVPEPGHILMSIDFSQQEYRLMLAYAGQMDVIQDVMGGADLHEATARRVGVARSRAKTINFAVLYGSGNDNLAAMLGISVHEAAILRNKYYCAMPRVLNLISKIKRTVLSEGYVTNWLGRRLHLPGGLSSMSYAVPNHLIQGGGADICKRAMVEVAPALAGTGIKMTKQVHDQLVFQVPKCQVDKMLGIPKIMEEVFPEKNGMRMKADMSWSDRSFAEADMKKGFYGV